MLVFLLFIQSCFASTPYPTSQIIPVTLDKKYNQAVDKSGDALYIQSGLESRFDMVKEYGNKEAHARGIDTVLGPVLFSYRVYSAKSISFRVLGNRVHLAKDRASVTIPF